jgi:mRNA interferase RelE/StbE
LIWKIEFDERARRELRRLDGGVQERILHYLRKRIATDQDPRRYGETLKGEFTGLWKYRVGAYLIVCEIQHDTITVIVVRVGHRREIYR